MKIRDLKKYLVENNISDDAELVTPDRDHNYTVASVLEGQARVTIRRGQIDRCREHYESEPLRPGEKVVPVLVVE